MYHSEVDLHPKKSSAARTSPALVFVAFSSTCAWLAPLALLPACDGRCIDGTTHGLGCQGTHAYSHPCARGSPLPHAEARMSVPPRLSTSPCLARGPPPLLPAVSAPGQGRARSCVVWPGAPWAPHSSPALHGILSAASWDSWAATF